MTGSPSTSTAADAATTEARSGDARSLISGLLLAAAVACIALLLVVLPASRRDPYVRATLALEGSAGSGDQLFRMNCASCHGAEARGLVGPNLHGVSRRRSDSALIHQVVSGETPPMPSFEPNPQAMADLLAYLHSLE
ncbi:cytochrome c [Synechococcus sp. RSCCF101]|uniref:c-type cytochrome n=1 Tax=Synechococcus sp. RSCCF101 TaxID=2511069 RepID=UPI001CDA0C7F|nr:cytochrome c [Synechococcus sp. RSCCF101]